MKGNPKICRGEIAFAEARKVTGERGHIERGCVLSIKRNVTEIATVPGLLAESSR